MREHVGIYETDEPVKFGENAVNKDSVFIYDYLIENMLTKEEIYTLRCRTKLGMEWIDIAIILDCSERTAQRSGERAIKKLRNLTRYLNYSKIKALKSLGDTSEEMARDIEKRKSRKKKKGFEEVDLF